MSIIAKQTFIAELRERLRTKMTLAEIEELSREISEQLTYYKMERVEEDDGRNEFEEFLSLFINTKRIEGRSEKTLDRYAYILKRYKETDPTPIHKITVYNIRQYLAKEKTRGIADSTLQGYRDVFSAFFGWIHRERLMPLTPCANLNPIKCKKEIRLPYTSVEIERLKEVCSSVRDKAIICFLLSTGCRISEVCGLNRADVDFNNLECTVLGKGNKERTVYLDSVAAMQLQKYLDSREDDDEALFTGKGTSRMQPGGIRKCLRVIGDRAGVPNVHPHRFRRTLATNLIKHGMPIQEVANILGHEKLDTTMMYVYLDKQSVKNSYKKYS